MNLLRDEYLRHFGKSLDVALAEGMGPWDAKVAEKMMSQDPNTRTEGMIEYLENNSQSWYGTEDEEFIFSSLENLSVEERTRLVQDPRFGAVLEGWYDDLGTNEYALVEALTRLDPTTGRAEANPAHVAAAKIKIAMHGGTAWKFWEGMGTDESTIESELSKLTPEQVQEMEAYYNQYLGRGSTFQADVTDEYNDGVMGKIMKNVPLVGDAMALGVAIGGVVAGVATIIGSGGAGTIAGVALIAGSLAAAKGIHDLTKTPTGLKIVLAELNGDKAAADAHRIHQANQTDIGIGLGNPDKDAIKEILQSYQNGEGGRSIEDFDRFKTTFDAMYQEEYKDSENPDKPALDVYLSENFSGMERDYFSDLADNGQLDDPATALIYSMAGWGTDETIAREAMEAVHGMSPEEREKFNRKFGALASQMGYTETTLEEWIDGDFGKDEALDLKIQALGAPLPLKTICALRACDMNMHYPKTAACLVVPCKFLATTEAVRNAPRKPS